MWCPGPARCSILTEGVVLYLEEEQVAELAQDLLSQPRFAFWLAESLSPQVYPYMQALARTPILGQLAVPVLPAGLEGVFPGQWLGDAGSALQHRDRAAPWPHATHALVDASAAAVHEPGREGSRAALDRVHVDGGGAIPLKIRRPSVVTMVAWPTFGESGFLARQPLTVTTAPTFSVSLRQPWRNSEFGDPPST